MQICVSGVDFSFSLYPVIRRNIPQYSSKRNFIIRVQTSFHHIKQHSFSRSDEAMFFAMVKTCLHSNKILFLRILKEYFLLVSVLENNGESIITLLNKLL